MKDEKPQYKPQNHRTNIEDLVCPKCGNDVLKEQYNDVTQLIKCLECDNVFAYLGAANQNEISTEIQPTNIDTIPTDQKSTNGSPYLIGFVVILLIILVLWYLRDKS